MISVIIPVYNSVHKGLEECLQRVAAQTYNDLQVIMIDDGSLDGSGKICDEWAQKDPRFEVVHQKNQGPALARNQGLCLVKGEEIAFIDSDDMPDESLLSELHEAMAAGKSEMAMTLFDGDSIPSIKLTGESLTGRELQLGLFDYYTPLYKNLFAKLYRRDLLENLYFEDLRTAEDIDFLSRVYLRVKCCAFVNHSLYIYNRYEDSVMHSQTVRDYQDILWCYENIVERLSVSEDEILYGRALDALMRKVVSIGYRNRTLKDCGLASRLEALKRKYFSVYCWCKNGNIVVKLGLLTCLKFPWLHAVIMNYRER